ncbi:hypothetical protein [Kitasatospora sp. NBC_00315]|uniref:hypothetical protein n=1 Tax=Kitasatospora sp. NBC_00315 TaxID=2975963 RepID=UPI003253E7D3
MAISRGLWRYLESGRNLAGCAGGTAGLVLHFTGVAGPWWPAVVAGLYGVGALLAPGPRRGPGTAVSAVSAPAVAGPVRTAEELLSEELRAELAELADHLADVQLPWSAGVEELLTALGRTAAAGRPGPDAAALRTARLVATERLPIALDGYLRARSWERWATLAQDPVTALRREVDLMAASLG